MSILTILIVAVFCVGYLCIALESLTKINKAAIALLMCVVCWTLLMMSPTSFYPEIAGDQVIHHIAEVSRIQMVFGFVHHHHDVIGRLVVNQ